MQYYYPHLLCRLLLVNTNDFPSILFSDNAVAMYYEGSGSVVLDPQLVVIDNDPEAMIYKLVVIPANVFALESLAAWFPLVPKGMCR